MREFEGGATRNSIEGKLSYMRALSPEVLRRYVQYLAEHRHTPKGLRDFDNWKKGIPEDTYCDSLLRHSFDAWLTLMGYDPSDTNYDLEDLLCAIIFNAQGWLFELIHLSEREDTAAVKERNRIEAYQDEGGQAEISPIAKTCGECSHYHSSLADHCSVPGLYSTGPDDLVNECARFVPKVPA